MGLPLLGRFRTGLVQGYKIVFFTNDIRGIFFTFPLISTFCYISKEIHLAGFAKLCLSKIAAIRPETLRLKCKIIAPEEPNNHTQQSKASKNADRGRKKKKKKGLKTKATVAHLIFIMATLNIVFEREKLRQMKNRYLSAETFSPIQ